MMKKMIKCTRASVFVLVVLCVVDAARSAAQPLPNPLTLPGVHLLATGGTIAAVAGPDGAYTAGRIGVETLLAAVPALRDVAAVTGEQVVNIASQDMNDQVWIALLDRVRIALADDRVTGVVITHGTDTMEETALFLDRTVGGDKPVVLTGSMRTPTAPGADGPANLLAAVRVAVAPAARGRGCLVVMNDQIYAANGVTKRHTTAVQTFGAPNTGPVGELVNGAPVFFSPVAPRSLPFTGVFERASLPHVAIIYGHANLDGALIDAAVSHGATGIVLAGVGNGNASQAALSALDRARQAGVVVVRSSRAGSGYVSRNIEIDDDARGFVAAGYFSPQQARVVLTLGLTQTNDPAEIQELFLAAGRVP